MECSMKHILTIIIVLFLLYPSLGFSETKAQASEWFEKGLKYHTKGEYDKAIEAYTSAIVLNPNYADAYNNRGLEYDNKGQYDRAIEDFNKAIAINPNDAKTYYNRGLAYDNKGQYDRAIEDFNKAITL